MEAALGAQADRMALLRGILQAMFEWRLQIHTESFQHAWEQRLAFRGQQVRIEGTDNESITGEVLGIDGSGNLLLRDTTGETIPVTVGDVHLRPV